MRFENLIALWLLAEELLKNVLLDCTSPDDLEAFLDACADKSPIAKLWVEVFLRSVFTCMDYVRAKREGDFILHLYTVRRMLHVFFTAGRPNYSRYGWYYLESMLSCAFKRWDQ